MSPEVWYHEFPEILFYNRYILNQHSQNNLTTGNQFPILDTAIHLGEKIMTKTKALVIFICLTLLSLVLYAQNTYVSSMDSFKVDFPGEVSVTEEDNINTYLCTDQGDGYGITVMQLSEDTTGTDNKKFLDMYFTNYVSGYSGEKDISKLDFKGYECKKAVITDVMHYTIFCFNAEDKMYSLICYGLSETIDLKKIFSFLESFEILSEETLNKINEEDTERQEKMKQLKKDRLEERKKRSSGR